MRGGRECLVTNTDVVVGDVLLLDTGDRVVADGVAVEAHGLTIDEARALALADGPVLVQAGLTGPGTALCLGPPGLTLDEMRALEKSPCQIRRRSKGLSYHILHGLPCLRHRHEGPWLDGHQ